MDSKYSIAVWAKEVCKLFSPPRSPWKRGTAKRNQNHTHTLCRQHTRGHFEFVIPDHIMRHALFSPLKLGATEKDVPKLAPFTRGPDLVGLSHCVAWMSLTRQSRQLPPPWDPAGILSTVNPALTTWWSYSHDSQDAYTSTVSCHIQTPI